MRKRKEDKEELHKGSKVERHDTIRHARSPPFLKRREKKGIPSVDLMSNKGPKGMSPTVI